MLREFQPDLLPGLCGIGRLVHAVARVGHHTAHRMFTHAHIDDVRIAFRNRDGSNRTGLEKTIRDVTPTDSHVICFPETAARGAHVIGFRIADNSGGTIRAPAAKGANRSPFQRFENGVVIIRSRRLFGLRG